MKVMPYIHKTESGELTNPITHRAYLKAIEVIKQANTFGYPNDYMVFMPTQKIADTGLSTTLKERLKSFLVDAPAEETFQDLLNASKSEFRKNRNVGPDLMAQLERLLEVNEWEMKP